MPQAGDKTIEVYFVQLYMAILLAFLMRSCPELRQATEPLGRVPRLVADLKAGLAFYVGNHAMEAASVARMHALIEYLTQLPQAAADVV